MKMGIRICIEAGPRAARVTSIHAAETQMHLFAHFEISVCCELLLEMRGGCNVDGDGASRAARSFKGDALGKYRQGLVTLYKEPPMILPRVSLGRRQRLPKICSRLTLDRLLGSHTLVRALSAGMFRVKFKRHCRAGNTRKFCKVNLAWRERLGFTVSNRPAR